MIFHSANNLKRKKKRKEKKKKKKKEKRKKKKNKRGHKTIEIKSPCNNSNLAITFKHGQVIFKFDVDRVVNDLAKQFNLSQSV
jgi:hypothetical protein